MSGVVRTVALALLVAAVVVSCSPLRSAEQALRRTAQFTKLQQYPAASRRSFAQLEWEVPEVCKSDAFNLSFSLMKTQCASFRNDMTPNENSTTAEVNTYLDGLCPSQCMNSSKYLLDHPEYAPCIEYAAEKDMHFYYMVMMMAGVGCTSSSNNEYCAAKLFGDQGRWLSNTLSGSRCLNQSYETCHTLNECAWHAKFPIFRADIDEYCVHDVLNVIPQTCDDVCVTGLISAHTFFPKDWDEIGASAAMMCHREEGQICSVVMSDVDKLDSNDMQDFHHALGAVCSSSARYSCSKYFVEEDMKRRYPQIVDNYKNCTSYDQNPQSYCEGLIVPFLQEWHAETERFKHMCSRNEQGKWCMQIPQEMELEKDACFDPKSWTDGVCSAECDTKISDIFTAAGCCAKTLDVIFALDSNQDYNRSLVPNAPSPLPTVSSNTTSDMDMFKKCTKVVVPENACAEPTGQLTPVNECYTAEFEEYLTTTDGLCMDVLKPVIQAYENGTMNNATTPYKWYQICPSDCFQKIPKLLSNYSLCLTREIRDVSQFVVEECDRVAPKPTASTSKPLPAECASEDFKNTIQTVLLSCVVDLQNKVPPNSSSSSVQVTNFLDEMCSTNCFTAAKNFVSNFAQFASCVDLVAPESGISSEEARTVLMLASVGCTKDNNEYCALSMVNGTAMQHYGQGFDGDLCHSDAVQNSEEACTAAVACKWEQGKCTYDYKTAVPATCENVCMSGFIQSYMFFPKDMQFLGLQSKTMCHQEGSDYCYVAVAPYMNMFGEQSGSGSGGMNSMMSILRPVCSSTVRFKCLDYFLQADYENRYEKLLTNYENCMIYLNSTTKCSDVLVPFLKEWHTETERFKHMCSRNEQGKWCMQIPQEVEASTEECYDPETWTGGECSAVCDTKIAALYSDAGCCIRTLETFFALENNTEYDRSLIPNAPEATEGTAPVSSMEGNPMETFKKCPSVTAPTADPCPKPATVTPVSECYSGGFEGDMEKIAEQCGGDIFDAVIKGDFSNRSRANTVWHDVCSSACVELFPRLDGFKHCLDRQTVEVLNLITAGCEKDNEEYCGAVVSQVQEVDCSAVTKDKCSAQPNCAWFQDGKTDTACDVNMTVGGLTDMCSPCMFKFANALGVTSEYGQQLLQATNLLCVKHNDEFCYPSAMQAIHGMGMAGFQESTLTQTCGAPAKVACMRKIMLAQSMITKFKIDNQLRTCLSTTSPGFKSCTETFIHQVSTLQQNQKMVEVLCTNNDGVLCLAIMHKYEDNTCFSDLANKTCNSTCKQLVQQVVTEAGCCLATLQQLFGEGISYVQVGDFPSVSGYNFSSTVPALPSSGSGIFIIPPGTVFYPQIGTGFALNFDVCEGLNVTLNVSLHYGCDRPYGEKLITKTLQLPIPFKRLMQDTVFATKLLNSMVGDISRSLGVALSSITNARFVEDTTASVRVSSRRMQVLASSSATKFEFSLRAESDDETDATSALFDNLLTSNTLSLSSSETLVSDECSDCLAMGAASLSSQGAIIQETEASGSGPLLSGAVTVLAIVVAVLFA